MKGKKKNQRHVVIVNNLSIEVIQKPIKHIYLKVNSVDGSVRVSAPLGVSLNRIEQFVRQKWEWVQSRREQINKVRKIFCPKWETGETHYFRGKPYLLKVLPSNKPRVIFTGEQELLLWVPRHYTAKQRKNYYERWLRKAFQKELEVLVPKWEQIMGIRVKEVRIKKMKTRWGSCNPRAQRIWLNLELMKSSPECLEYVVVHEMVHFFEASHNHRFQRYMSKFLPDWKILRKKLNEERWKIGIP